MSEKPNYDKITTVDEVDEEIQKTKDLICRRVKERGQIKDARKDAMKGYNDELKRVEEELDYNTGVLDELGRHKRLILAGAVPGQKLHSV